MGCVFNLIYREHNNFSHAVFPRVFMGWEVHEGGEGSREETKEQNLCSRRLKRRRIWGEEMWKLEVGGEQGGEGGEDVGEDSKDRTTQDKCQHQENYRLQFFTNQRYGPLPLPSPLASSSSPFSYLLPFLAPPSPSSSPFSSLLPFLSHLSTLYLIYRWSQWA